MEATIEFGGGGIMLAASVVSVSLGCEVVCFGGISSVGDAGAVDKTASGLSVL